MVAWLSSFGIDSVDPHPECHYTKHVILLINELDISCGDFLPAIFQDNNHATIVGTRTAGAGGCVISHSFPNRFGIESFNYTVSLAKRIDGSTIENLGVTPEIILEKTVNDLQNDYVDYKSRLLEIVNSTLK